VLASSALHGGLKNTEVHSTIGIKAGTTAVLMQQGTLEFTTRRSSTDMIAGLIALS
jgi:hypothetical protein